MSFQRKIDMAFRVALLAFHFDDVVYELDCKLADLVQEVVRTSIYEAM